MLKFLILFLIIPTFCISQNSNSIWVFGDSAGIDFTVPTNPIPITSGMDGRGSSASISDSTGELLFYSYTRAGFGDWAVFVHNKQNAQMANGDSINGAGWYHELQIIPFSLDIYKYYLFSYGSDEPNNEGLYYSIVDITLNGGLGDVSIKDIQINPNRIADCLTSVKHGNGRDWWVISKLSDTNGTQHNRFFKYLITSDSIVDFPYQDMGGATDVDFQKLIWHPSHDKFMLINTNGYMAEYTFDRCSGNIGLNKNIFPEQTSNFNRLFWEGAYSPNGDIFYVTTDFWFGVDTSYLFQLDLTSFDIPGTMDTLDGTVAPLATGAVRLAPDNKIYFTRWYLCNAIPYCYPYPDSIRNIYNENLSVINSPDSLGNACDYQPFSFYLGGKRTYSGLPNNPNYDLGPLVGSPCDSLTVGINESGKLKPFGILYPNPATNRLNYVCNIMEGKKGHFELKNSVGSTVLNQMIRSNINEIKIDELSSGIYYYIVKVQDAIVDKGKLVISK